MTGLSASTSKLVEPNSEMNCTSSSPEFGNVTKYGNSILLIELILSHSNEYFA